MGDMQQPLILGTDFLSKTQSTIKYTSDPHPEYQPTRAVRSVTIPPFSELALTSQITSLQNLEDITGTIENLQRDREVAYIVQRAAVKPSHKNRHPVVLLNLTSRPIKIKKGDIIAVYSKADYPDDIPASNINNNYIHNISACNTIINDTSDPEDIKRLMAESPTPSICAESDTEDIEDFTPLETTPPTQHPTQESSVNTALADSPLLDQHQKQRFTQLLTNYEDVFVQKDGQLGITPLYTHEIHLKPDATPCHYYPFRSSPQNSELLEQHCEKLVNQGVLEETTSGPWASRSFLVEKKDGKHRLVTDFRYLNSCMINQALISPRADDSIEMIGQMKPAVFSKMDAQQGFFQIPLREEDKDKTAFLTRTKKYRYRCMPMGLSSSSQAFQSLVNLILQNLQFRCAIPYLDDILCLSPTVDQHFTDLENIFKALRRGNLKLKKSKCEFFLQEMTFLGMLITPDGIKPAPEKVDKINSFPTPTNVKEVRSFTGLAQFYRKFIKDFSKISRPLFDLLQKDSDFKWSPDCEHAFNKLKQAISKDVVLQYPDYNKDFHLETDASGTALGATLSQCDSNNKLRPVAFAGRALNIHEQNYSTTQRELLGIVFAMEHFRHYLEDRCFHLYTDHRPLIDMLTNPNSKHMLSRWALKIQQFKYKIQHIKGKHNITADALSRRSYTPNSKLESEPPPPPKKIKIARRIHFKEKLHQIQEFSPSDSPHTIIKQAPKSILKQHSAHHIVCDCSDNTNFKPTSYQSSNFTTVKEDQDKRMIQPAITIQSLMDINPADNTTLTPNRKPDIKKDQRKPSHTATRHNPKTQRPAFQDNPPQRHDTCMHTNTPPDTTLFTPTLTQTTHTRQTPTQSHTTTSSSAPSHTSTPNPTTQREPTTPNPPVRQTPAPSSPVTPTTPQPAIMAASTKTSTPTPQPTTSINIKAKDNAPRMAKHLRQQHKHILELLNQFIDPSLTLLNLKREQRQDPKLQDLITFLEKDTLPDTKSDRERTLRESQDHLILEGMLVHINTALWKHHNELSFQPVVPKVMQKAVLQHFHDVPMAGHAGHRKMLSTMIPKVHWKGMPTDIQKYCSSCNICLKAKKFNINPKSPMQQHNIVSHPFEFVHIDAIGPLPETPAGHKYIQVVVDRFTKFCIAYSTTSLDADTTAAEFITNVILAHTVPSTLQSDNGTSYTGTKFKNMTNIFRIKHVFSTPYRPKSNGQAERYVQTISTGIRAYCMDNQTSWDIYLPYVVHAINTHISSTTQYSPFFMLHGYHPNTIIDNAFNSRPEAKSALLHVRDKLITTDHAYNKAQANIKARADANKKHHDVTAKPTPITQGSVVYVKVPRLLDRTKNLKLQEAFSGPYIVCAHRTPTSVVIKCLQTMKTAKRPVHVDRLKLVTHVRNNVYFKRLINPNDDLISKLWKEDKNTLTPTKALLATTPRVIQRRSHSKVQKTSYNGLKSS